MAEIIPTLNYLLALGGVVLACASIVLTVDSRTKEKILEKVVRTYGLFVAFAITATGSVLTLIYSEVFGFIPCGLCWLQRVFLYPQVILLAVAIATKDKTVAKYGIALSIPGIVVSLYQHYLQMGGAQFITCPVTGAGADCAERILFEFGFMTFPLMSACLFAFLIALYIYLLKTKN